MKRRFKSKITKNYKGTIYIFLFGLSFICTVKLLMGDTFNTKEYLLSSLLNESTGKSNIIIEKVSDQVSSPKHIIYNGLNKIVAKNNLSVFSSIEDDDFDYDEASSEYVEDPNPETPDNPLIYIYNTHQLEEYSSSMPYDYSVKPNVMIASYVMREKLSANGLSSVVETNSVKDFIDENKLSYNRSYLATETFARAKQKEYPSIKYLIDIHRDSVDYSISKTEIDGVSYARVLFVVGLEHTPQENNVGFAEKFDEIIKRDYPGLSRGVLTKTGTPNPSVYNPNLNGKSVLIEIGGPENKIEEVYNTVEVLSNVLTEIIKEEEGI